MQIYECKFCEGQDSDPTNHMIEKHPDFVRSLVSQWVYKNAEENLLTHFNFLFIDKEG